MGELLEEWLGTIAVLVYLLYPVLKRWLDRRKQKTEARRKQAEARAGAESGAAQGAEAQPAPAKGPDQPPKKKASRRARREERRRAAEREILAQLQTHLERLSKKTRALLQHTDRAPEVGHLARPLREELVGPLNDIARSLRGATDGPQLVEHAEQLQELEALLGYLQAAVQQRLGRLATSLVEADRIAEACYRPFAEFARAHGLRLPDRVVIAAKTRGGQLPMPVSGVALIHLPAGFERDVRSWPSIAHEVAHDLYQSVDRLESDLHHRLRLPYHLPAPSVEMELDGTFIREMFGPWLAEVFSDVLATVMLGPAYGETLRHDLRDRNAPHRTAAVLARDGLIDRHPPARLRLYIASQVLRRLGREEEGRRLWQQWQADHPEVGFFYLPLGGQWVGVPDDTLTTVADSIIATFLDEPWPELDGFRLMSIRGLAYSHAEQAEVERLMPILIEGVSAEADARWVVAAAVLATIEAPSARGQILGAARRSLFSVEMPAAIRESRGSAMSAGLGLGDELRRSVGDPVRLRKAIILGALLTKRRQAGRQRPNP